jgi:hypothetical protein
LGNEDKRFHFQEIDKIICFPDSGNEKKKYAEYAVNFWDRKSPDPDGNPTQLGAILCTKEFENGYPHTVAFFKKDQIEGEFFNPDYLEIRRICYIEEFWKFLNDLDI